MGGQDREGVIVDLAGQIRGSIDSDDKRYVAEAEDVGVMEKLADGPAVVDVSAIETVEVGYVNGAWSNVNDTVPTGKAGTIQLQAAICVAADERRAGIEEVSSGQGGLAVME